MAREEPLQIADSEGCAARRVLFFTILGTGWGLLLGLNAFAQASGPTTIASIGTGGAITGRVRGPGGVAIPPALTGPTRCGSQKTGPRAARPRPNPPTLRALTPARRTRIRAPLIRFCCLEALEAPPRLASRRANGASASRSSVAPTTRRTFRASAEAGGSVGEADSKAR